MGIERSSARPRATRADAARQRRPRTLRPGPAGQADGSAAPRNRPPARLAASRDCGSTPSSPVRLELLKLRSLIRVLVVITAVANTRSSIGGFSAGVASESCASTGAGLGVPEPLAYLESCWRERGCDRRWRSQSTANSAYVRDRASLRLGAVVGLTLLAGDRSRASATRGSGMTRRSPIRLSISRCRRCSRWLVRRRQRRPVLRGRMGVGALVGVRRSWTSIAVGLGGGGHGPSSTASGQS